VSNDPESSDDDLICISSSNSSSNSSNDIKFMTAFLNEEYHHNDDIISLNIDSESNIVRVDSDHNNMSNIIDDMSYEINDDDKYIKMMEDHILPSFNENI
jgi:hypothetical protein